MARLSRGVVAASPAGILVSARQPGRNAVLKTAAPKAAVIAGIALRQVKP
jgi:hypothetical protein